MLLTRQERESVKLGCSPKTETADCPPRWRLAGFRDGSSGHWLATHVSISFPSVLSKLGPCPRDGNGYNLKNQYIGFRLDQTKHCLGRGLG